MKRQLRFIVVFMLIGAFSAQAVALPKMASGWYWPTEWGDSIMFGWLDQNQYWNNYYHLAVDIKNNGNQPVYAIGDGEVVASGEYSGYGNNGNAKGGCVLVRYRSADGTWFSALYGHVDNYLTSGSVTAGAVIGYTGPDWSPPHLHFGIRPGYEVNASNWMNGYGTTANDTRGFTDPISFLNSHPMNNEIRTIKITTTVKPKDTFGKILPLNPTINYGTNTNLTATPNDGYGVGRWYIDTFDDDGALPEYDGQSTFPCNGFGKDHTIFHLFKIKISTVVTSSNAGSISPSNPKVFTSNPTDSTLPPSHVDLKAIPNAGYAVGRWYIDSIDAAGALPEYDGKSTFPCDGFGKPHTIYHMFKVIVSTVASPANSGTITPANPTVYPNNPADPTLPPPHVDLKAVPNAGYAVGNWSFDGSPAPDFNGKDTFPCDGFGKPHTITHTFIDYVPTSLRISIDPGGGYIGAYNGISLNYNLSGPQQYDGFLALDNSGISQIDELKPGAYDLTITGSHWLKRIVKNFNINGAHSINTSLANGDADGDNSVNLFDFAVLDTRFGSSDQMADLNGDGRVNLFDYVIIDQNFGALGD